jgi:hypothetical protein
MPEKKISNYKASTILRSICFVTLGFQAFAGILAFDKEEYFDFTFSILFIVLSVYGIFVTTQKNVLQYQVFGVLFVLAGVCNVLFRFVSFNWKYREQSKQDNLRPSLRDAGSSKYLSVGVEASTSIIQLIITIGGILLSFMLWSN